jgi:hypothetical protein
VIWRTFELEVQLLEGECDECGWERACGGGERREVESVERGCGV